MGQENKSETPAAGVNIGGGQVHVDGDIIGRDKIVYEARALSIPALHQLPPPPRDFTGRQTELAELTAAVEKGGVTISGLQGLGGVGKTALALKLAEQLSQKYQDGQLYLDLKGINPNPLNPKQAMEHVIRAYYPVANLPENETELLGLYRSVLHGKRTILLMDNARDAEQVKLLIPPASCLLVVTSRQHFVLPGLAAKNLDALPPSDARELLLRIAPRLDQEERDYAGELARLCGYLPQAIVPVGSTLAARADLRPADYVHRLADARERLKLTETDASFSLSYDLLAGELQQRFLSLAVFPDTFHAAGAAAVWDVVPERAQDFLSELSLYSLVEFNSATSRYRLHDLVRVFAEARLDLAERKASQRRHAEYYINVLAAADQLYKQGNDFVKIGLLLFDTEWTNIQSGQAWASEHAGEDDEAARLCNGFPLAGLDCLALRLHPRESIEWSERALVAARGLKDSRAEGWHLGNLGCSYSSLAEFRRAIEYHEKALQIMREMADRHDEGVALGSLSIAHYSLGEYHRAIEYSEQHLEIARAIRDGRGEGNALGNLGNTYYLLGEYRRAKEYYEQHLEIARKAGNRRGEGIALGNLGNAYSSLEQYAQAIECYEKRLQIAREIGDREGAGTALGNLGIVYDSLGQCRRAIEYHGKHLEIAQEIGDIGGEGRAHWNISFALEKLGKRSEAIAHAEKALRIYEQIENPNAAMVRKKLAEWGSEGWIARMLRMAALWIGKQMR